MQSYQTEAQRIIGELQAQLRSSEEENHRLKQLHHHNAHLQSHLSQSLPPTVSAQGDFQPPIPRPSERRPRHRDGFASVSSVRCPVVTSSPSSSGMTDTDVQHAVGSRGIIPKRTRYHAPCLINCLPPRGWTAAVSQQSRLAHSQASRPYRLSGSRHLVYNRGSARPRARRNRSVRG